MPVTDTYYRDLYSKIRHLEVRALFLRLAAEDWRHKLKDDPGIIDADAPDELDRLAGEVHALGDDVEAQLAHAAEIAVAMGKPLLTEIEASLRQLRSCEHTGFAFSGIEYVDELIRIYSAEPPLSIEAIALLARSRAAARKS